MPVLNVPLIIRGEVIENADITHGGRGGGVAFTAPDVGRHVGKLALGSPSAMADLHTLSVEDILDYLAAVGDRLTLGNNRWVAEAFELSCQTSGLGPDILRHLYETMGHAFDRSSLRELAERTIGLPYLDGWVEERLDCGMTARIRAFGARSVHIVAGNAPGTSVLTVVRNALTRGDAIIKTPSNDPLTAVAIARTMIEMAPDHPITRHLSVAYWKGGDEQIEEALYSPAHIEKIIAWGGFASIKHIAKYVGPGVELVALDPKLSSTIIGREAFRDETTMQRVAGALARDVGMLNQEACVNARVVYVESGIDEEGLNRINHFGAMLWSAIQALPTMVSTPAVRMEGPLHDEIDALRHSGDDWYKVIGGGRDGAVIVSQFDEPVDFARLLTNRVANLVPVDSTDVAVRAVTNYTQTIGIWPESLKHDLRDRLALHGAQRLVSLGSAIGMANHGIQDAIEPLRRMCRWIVEEVTPEPVVEAA